MGKRAKTPNHRAGGEGKRAETPNLPQKDHPTSPGGDKRAKTPNPPKRGSQKGEGKRAKTPNLRGDKRAETPNPPGPGNRTRGVKFRLEMNTTLDYDYQCGGSCEFRTHRKNLLWAHEVQHTWARQ